MTDWKPNLEQRLEWAKQTKEVAEAYGQNALPEITRWTQGNGIDYTIKLLELAIAAKEMDRYLLENAGQYNIHLAQKVHEALKEVDGE